MRRKPKPVSATSLENAALFYLKRFATSAENLRRVLLRKVRRTARLTGDDVAEGEAMVEPIIGRLNALGLLDDSAYAHNKAASLANRGLPARRIRADLHRRGLAEEHIDRAMSALSETGTHTDFRAAVRFAMRRRLGPFRSGRTDARMRARDLAALARAGFPYAIARGIVDAESVEILKSAETPEDLT